MAGSKYAYVKSFEMPDSLLPNTFMVARLDGHAFHRFSSEHDFIKPNDERALRLMDHAAMVVMQEFPDIVLGFGESDEFSFLFKKSCTLYNRRSTKIITTLTSLFTSAYVINWSQYFQDIPLKYPPSFDGRIVLYPSNTEVRDYFSWRQTDTHINNLYNTVFWALVQQGGQTTAQAHETLRGTFSKEKNEILFSQFGINYNKIEARFRKGSVLVRQEIASPSDSTSEPVQAQEDAENSNTDPKSQQVQQQRSKKTKPLYETVVLHCDIIRDEFWEQHSYILAS